MAQGKHVAMLLRWPKLGSYDVVSNDRHVLPANTGDVVDIADAVADAQSAGGTDVKECCIYFDKPVNAGLKHGHRYRVFLSCSLYNMFDLFLCHSPCPVVSTR